MIIDATQDKVIELGRLGENEARYIRFPLDEFEEFPGATISLLNKRNGDPDAYPVANVEMVDGKLVWTVQSGDVAKRGSGLCELRGTLNNAIVKSFIYTTFVGNALDGNGDPPDPWKGWVDKVEDDADRAEAAADLLENPGAEAETLQPGSQATASYSNGVFHFGIPKGDSGSDVIDDSTTALDKTWSSSKLAQKFLNAPEIAGTQGQVLTSDGQGGQSWEDPTGGGGTVTDVQVNGTSVVSQGVANIPVAGANAEGVVKVVSSGTGYGLQLVGTGSTTLALYPAQTSDIKSPTANKAYNPITCTHTHEAAFYGLAKAAGDSTQSSSSNAVGVYTDEAKDSIQSMVGVTGIVGPHETASGGSSRVYAVGDVFVMNGKLYEATTDIMTNDFIIEGTNCSQTSVSSALGSKVNTNNPNVMGSISMMRMPNSGVGQFSIATGVATAATGMASVALGSQTQADGIASIATGALSRTEGTASRVDGYGLEAHGAGVHVSGVFNVSDNWNEWVANTQYEVGDKVRITRNIQGTTMIETYICKEANSDATFTASHWNHLSYSGQMDYAQIVGNGTSLSNTSNAYALEWNGNGHFAGDVYVGCNSDSTGGTRLPHDVQVNGVSVVNQGVANVPLASSSVIGAMKIGYGLTFDSTSNSVKVNAAGSGTIKSGSSSVYPIVPSLQHESVFFGLSKVAGVDLANETVTVGTYPASSITAIKSMLGVHDVEVVRLTT